MKKLIIAVILFTLCIYISGCSRDNQKTIWNMQSIQDNNGKIIYCCDKNKDIYPNATIKDIVCILQGSSITITDKNRSNEWIGKCTIIDSSENIYEIIFDNNETGTMGKSVTKYADNTQENTLVISCKGYTVYFTENTDKTN